MKKTNYRNRYFRCKTTHAIAEYKEYYEENDPDGLCNRKLFDILAGLKSAQQGIAAGIDDFVVESIEA